MKTEVDEGRMNGFLSSVTSSRGSPEYPQSQESISLETYQVCKGRQGHLLTQCCIATGPCLHADYTAPNYLIIPIS